MRSRYAVSPKLSDVVRFFLEKYPTYGVRKLAWIINREGQLDRRVNWKAIYRILKLKGWIQNKKRRGSRPRVKVSRSVASRPNERWALDTTHFPTKKGWCHMTAVIDC